MAIVEPVVPSLASPAELSAEAIGRRAMAKASWRLLPLLGLGYGAAFMDRVNISFASLQMNRDLHFSASIYDMGWAPGCSLSAMPPAKFRQTCSCSASARDGGSRASCSPGEYAQLA